MQSDTKSFLEFAGGTVPGRSHRLSGKNNQDAYHWLYLPGYSVAVVCDGCGSGQHTEVGAHIGARLVARAIATCALDAHTRVAHEVTNRTVEDHAAEAQCALEEQCGCSGNAAASPSDSFAVTVLEQARQDVLTSLYALSQNMGENLSFVINNYFLFTVVGVLVTPLEAVFFSLGDGVLVVNGQQIPLGPFPDNAPPYLAYGLVPGSLHTDDAQGLCFRVHCRLPIDEVQSFLIGTDGVQNLVQAARCCMPGKSERVGSLHQFWQHDRYFTNPDMIRRRLAGINRDVIAPGAGGGLHKEAGLLPDDTTLIVGRRRGTVEEQIMEVPDENR